MPRLTSEQRSEAIGMLRANVTVLQVANHFNVSRICIWELKTKFQNYHPTIPAPDWISIGEDFDANIVTQSHSLASTYPKVFV